jgi:integrase
MANHTFYLNRTTITHLVTGFPPVASESGDPNRSVYPKLKVATDLQIEPSRWSSRTGRPTPAFSKADGFILEKQLLDLAFKMNMAIQQAQQDGRMTPEEVRRIYQGLTATATKRIVVKTQAARATDMAVVEMLKEFEAKAESPLTVASYAAFRAKVEKFDPKITVCGITDGWREEFLAWVKGVHKLKDSSMWTACKHLCKILNEGKRRKMPVQADAEQRFKIRPKQTDVLTWDEIARIIRWRPKTERLEQIKVILLGLAFTGCRIGDRNRMFESVAMRNGVMCASFHTAKKCGDEHPLVMPLIPLPMVQVLAKHGTPRRRNENDIRVGFDEVMKACKIPKHITPHDCRRTLITLLLQAGISDYLIAKVWSGHSVKGGDRGILFGYDQGTVAAAQQTALRVLRSLGTDLTGGMKLF